MRLKLPDGVPSYVTSMVIDSQFLLCELVPAMETRELSKPFYAYVIMSWKPELFRFREEVEHALQSGSGDALTLAEMECTLDLIDADLAAMRAVATPDEETQISCAETAAIRYMLAKLTEQMRALVRE